MSLLIAILGYFLNSIAITIDKFLLTKRVPEPLTYIFYISALSMLALLLLPFSHTPSITSFIIISLSTISWSAAAYCMFQALKIGTLSRVIPVIGTLTPLFLLAHSSYSHNITPGEAWGVIILILGLIFITLPDWKGKIKFTEIKLEISSGFLFAVYFFLLKQSFLQSDFLTVTSWSRFVLIPAIIIFLLIPALRRKVFPHNNGNFRFNPLTGILFIFGQVAGGTSGMLLNFSVLLSNPTLVASLQGIQYLFLFLFSLILFKKFPKIFSLGFSVFNISTKLTGIIFIIFGLYILS